jgi:hypothetical protein
LSAQPGLSAAVVGSRRVNRARHTSLLGGEYDFSLKSPIAPTSGPYCSKNPSPRQA